MHNFCPRTRNGSCLPLAPFPLFGPDGNDIGADVPDNNFDKDREYRHSHVEPECSRHCAGPEWVRQAAQGLDEQGK